jgi:hypothetical protein
MEHLKKHVKVYFRDDQIAIHYPTDCGQNCPFPHTVVTFTVCPGKPCPPPVYLEE